MTYFSKAIVIILALWVSACATPHSITATDVRNFTLNQVDVVIPANARLSWPQKEESFRRIKNAAMPESVALDDVNAHLSEEIKKYVKNAYQAFLALDLTGRRKINIVVRVKGFVIPSLGERVLINNSAVFASDVDIVDHETGQILATHETAFQPNKRMVGGLFAIVTDAAGLTNQDIGPELIANHVSQIRSWLLK